MTAPTTELPRSNGHRGVPRPARSSSSQVPARSRGRVAAGVAVLAVGAILAGLLYGNLGDRSPVLVAARDIRPGQVIEAEDVRVARVAVDAGVETVPASRRTEIVGGRATVGVTTGGLLTLAGVTDGSTVPAGMTVVGAVVKPGQYPLGLREGDGVLVLVGGDGSSSRATDGVIVAVSSQNGPDGTAISLAVPDDRAATIAAAGAEGRLILMDPVE